MVKYTKYNSCGNDFIIIDNRLSLFLITDYNNRTVFKKHQSYINKLCDREKGIGADGLILLSTTLNPQVLYYMHYFNSNGLLGSFCGNGSMCCANFAANLDLYQSKNNNLRIGNFETPEGVFSFQSDIKSAKTKISMLDVIGYSKYQDGILINTGSPHYVLFISDLNNLNVIEEGKKIRYSDEFKKDGVNVTFCSYLNNTISIRTYERGVESETLSCGTGAVAAALCASLYNMIKDNSILVLTRGGELLVNFQRKQSFFSDIYLESIVKNDYTGTIERL